MQLLFSQNSTATILHRVREKVVYFHCTFMLENSSLPFYADAILRSDILSKLYVSLLDARNKARNGMKNKRRQMIDRESNRDQNAV